MCLQRFKYSKAPWTANRQTVTKADGFKIRVESPSAAAPESWEDINTLLRNDAKLVAASPTMYILLKEILIAYEQGLDDDLMNNVSLMNRVRNFINKIEN